MRLYFYRSVLVSFGILVLLTSCASMGRISIQVSVPAKRAVPNEIQSVVLMNRSMTPAFSDLDQDSLETLFIEKKLSLNNIFLDSVAADTTLKALANVMYESGRYDVVIPLRRNLPNTNSSYNDQLPSLTLAQVKQICAEFKVDALLTLENFYENVKTSFQVETGNIYTNGVSYKDYIADVQIAYHSNWKLYQPLEKLMVAKFEVKDTIFWERNGPSLQETYEKLPTIKEALISGAVENGENLASYISPSWKTEDRFYYITNNQDADKAVSLLTKNDWKGAQEIWMKYATSTSVEFRSKIEFNLALASEMNGDYKEAAEWAYKSFHTKYSRIAEDYFRQMNTHQGDK